MPAYGDRDMEDENVESDHLDSEEEDGEGGVAVEEFWRTADSTQLLQNTHDKDAQQYDPSGADEEDLDDNGEDEEEGDDADSGEECDMENDEYMNFVRSVFFDDGVSEISGTDGDEDEDYNPDADPTETHNNDQDDNDINDEYYHVTRKEVQDLVDASIHALARGPDTLTCREDVYRDRGGVPIGGSYGHFRGQKVSTATGTGEGTGQCGQEFSGGCSGVKHDTSSSTSTNAAQPSSLSAPPGSGGKTGVSSTHSTSSSAMQGPGGSVSTPHSIAVENERKLQELQKKNRLLSVLVSKMFAGAGAVEVLIYNACVGLVCCLHRVMWWNMSHCQLNLSPIGVVQSCRRPGYYSGRFAY